MTAAFLVGLAAGWLTFATVLGLALGALVRFADRHNKQPECVRAPETGAVWTEDKRWEEWA